MQRLPDLCHGHPMEYQPVSFRKNSFQALSFAKNAVFYFDSAQKRGGDNAGVPPIAHAYACLYHTTHSAELAFSTGAIACLPIVVSIPGFKKVQKSSFVLALPLFVSPPKR